MYRWLPRHILFIISLLHLGNILLLLDVFSYLRAYFVYFYILSFYGNIFILDSRLSFLFDCFVSIEKQCFCRFKYWSILSRPMSLSTNTQRKIEIVSWSGTWGPQPSGLHILRLNALLTNVPKLSSLSLSLFNSLFYYSNWKKKWDAPFIEIS